MSAMNAQGVLDAMSKPGWDGVLKATANLRQQHGTVPPEQQQKDLAELIDRVYRTEDGRQLFDWLVMNTILRGELEPPKAGADVELAERIGWMRAGQRELVREMLRLIGVARHSPPPTTKETDDDRPAAGGD